jgi:hypothetical protein
MKNEILTYLKNGGGYLQFTYNLNHQKYDNTFSVFEDYKNKNNPYSIPLKDAIEALERAYPTLIARVLLETDAELAGEEPRHVRQSRASRIMKEGMERIEDERKEKSERLESIPHPEFPDNSEDEEEQKKDV